jgi:MoxR-like ATPase
VDILLPGRDVADYDHEPAAVPLLQIRPQGGPLLLGEPGMGKTRALETPTAAWARSGFIASAPVRVDLDSVTGDASFEARVARRVTQRLVRATEPADAAAAPVLCVLDNVDR